MLRILMQGNSKRLEFVNLRRQLSNQRTLYVRLVEIPYRTERGEIAGLVHLIEDITRVVTLRQQLDTANYELQQGSDFFQVLASIAAHQVGEPLTAIRGFVELLLDGASGPLNEQQAIQLRSVAQSALQLQQATVGIMGMLQAAAKQVHLSLRPTELGELVHEALAMLEMKIHDKAIHVCYEVDKPLPRVLCDSDQTVTLLHNLLRMGVECAAKTGRLDIRLAQTPDQKRV
jgi:light-regulated signal transduction histidine kinase (bacteriophytochrome)